SDEAGGPDRLPGWFAARYREAAAPWKLAQSLDEAWKGYLSGLFAVCLRTVTPATIARKEHLVATIDRSLAEPLPSDPSWRTRLRAAAAALDALLRDFAPYDRHRFGGPVSRDRCVTRPRQLYPELWT